MYKRINKNSFNFGYYIFNNVSINKYKNDLKNYKPNQKNILKAYISDYIKGGDKNIHLLIYWFIDFIEQREKGILFYFIFFYWLINWLIIYRSFSVFY